MNAVGIAELNKGLTEYFELSRDGKKIFLCLEQEMLAQVDGWSRLLMDFRSAFEVTLDSSPLVYS